VANANYLDTNFFCPKKANATLCPPKPTLLATQKEMADTNFKKPTLLFKKSLLTFSTWLTQILKRPKLVFFLS
jgi:hypothetical protein